MKRAMSQQPVDGDEKGKLLPLEVEDSKRDSLSKARIKVRNAFQNKAFQERVAFEAEDYNMELLLK